MKLCSERVNFLRERDSIEKEEGERNVKVLRGPVNFSIIAYTRNTHSLKLLPATNNKLMECHLIPSTPPGDINGTCAYVMLYSFTF